MRQSLKLNILGVPFNGDGTPPEQDNPADSLRQARLLECLQSGGRTVTDLGNVEIPEFDGKRDEQTKILNLQTWLQVSERVAETIAKSDKNSFSLVLGADCSVLLGIFGGFALKGRKVGLVMLDGHTDYRQPETSVTGEPADIVLAVITGRGPQRVTAFFGKCPLVRQDDVIVYGYREPDEIETSKIMRFDRITMSRLGVKATVREGLINFDKELAIWLHLDVDVFDPSVMPVCYPEPNGLSKEEVKQFFETCFETGNIIGLSIGCYHPTLDRTGQGAKTILDLFSSLHFGKYRFTKLNPLDDSLEV